MSDQPNRRTFLKTVLATVASLFLPKFLFAKGKTRSFWFLHADTGDSWSVANPVQWSLENAQQPILDRAREGLLRLTPSDGDRIIRLVTRRCRLNLIELIPGQVVVHHWGQQGLADVRPFFKTHSLARGKIKVVVRNRKKETVTKQTGDDFLFGERVAAYWLLKLYRNKWNRRFEEQPDDWSAAPGTYSGYAWDGIEDDSIPWVALKSAWRRTAPLLCSNCDKPTILANFGFPWTSMLNRYPRFLHVCPECRRLFEDHSVRDVPRWMVANLDAEVQPDCIMMWDRRVNL